MQSDAHATCKPGQCAAILSDSAPTLQLSDACTNNCVHCVRHLLNSLDANVDLEPSLDCGELSAYCALYAAASAGAHECVAVLLERGADASRGRADGVTPLHRAVQCGHRDVAQLLLEHGADANAADRIDGTSPLAAAAGVRQAECVRLLIEHGASVDSRTQRSLMTPLLIACDAGDAASVLALLEAGADVNAADKLGRTPLVLADGLCMRLLVQEGARAGADKAMWGAMSPFISHERVELLCKAGADPNRRLFGRVLLIEVLRSVSSVRDEAAVMALLESGADVNAADERTGDTALHVALEMARANLAMELLRRGAKAHLRNAAGKLPAEMYPYGELPPGLKEAVEQAVDAVGRSVKSARRAAPPDL